MKTETMKISPLMANRILSKNVFINRKIRQNHVIYLSSQMSNGKWRLTGESIKFNKDQGLIDGQYRLRAIIRSNTTQEFLVITNLSNEIFKVIDTGKNRTAGDVLSVIGVSNSDKMSSMIRSYVRMRDDQYYRAGGSGSIMDSELSSNEYILDEFNKRPDYWIDLCKKTGVWYKSYQHLLGRSVIGSLYAIINDKALDGLVDSFFTILCNMNFGADPNNPQKRLTKLLVNNSMSIKRYKPIIIKAIIIKTWNAFYKDEKIKTLKYSETDNFPEILPKNL